MAQKMLITSFFVLVLLHQHLALASRPIKICPPSPTKSSLKEPKPPVMPLQFRINRYKMIEETAFRPTISGSNSPGMGHRAPPSSS